jgi:hypothetical protein
VRAPRVGAGKQAVAADYSKVRQTFTNPEGFLSYMRGYPNTTGITLYLYRVWPKIDLSLIGHGESNIQKGGFEDLLLYTPETIARNFGRGAYQVKVTDSNRAEGEKEVVRSFTFDITDCEKAPVYDLRTLKLAEPKNTDEVNRLIVQGLLVRDASGAPRLRTAADISPVPVAAAVAPVDTSANNLIVQFAMEAFKSTRQSPTEAVKDVVSIAQLLQRDPAPVPSIDQIADAVAVRLGGGRGGDPFSTWEKVQGFIERAGGVVASQAGGVAAAVVTGDGAGSSWAPHLASIISEARAFVPELVNAWEFIRSPRSAAAAGPIPREGVMEMLPIDKRIETIFKAGFESMQRGITGAQFAQWLCLSGELPGGLEAFNLLKPAGAAGLIAMASTNPLGAQIVNDAAVRPQLDRFLGEFFSFESAAGAASASAA